ncbi:B12-binding domain-containing radical SAM protein [Streptomyces marispadix]|uniref:Radical SAM protein n=1 Tax=Streptomyces marispadix TaxID=2922868 RepID=A0ABS9SZ96_9ACTN|nr:radical SAM protein [Streptomyces marispadix]MCH6161600.1 radical SAM protein [Streptomyces marispadix]
MHRSTSGRAWLAFPPLVDTNFGSFYPSTAVLAAYLEAAGVDCVQADLNEEFALWLLERTRDTDGRPPGVGQDTMAGAAARWLARSHDSVFDEQGRHDFGPESEYGYLVRLLAGPFLVDPDESVLGPVDRERPVVAAYEEFYAAAGIADRVPEDTSLIGISVPMGPQLLPALLLAERIKATGTAAPVVLGGPALSLMSTGDLGRLLRAHPAVDCVVRFDGEQPLLELVEQAAAGRWDPGSVAGVSHLSADGPLHNDPVAGPNLNSLPVPSYPREALSQLASPTLAVTQARGCYWGKCDYCDFIELYDGSPPFRGRHPGPFLDELAELVGRFGKSRFTFITESIPPAFARRVCRGMLERGLDITWSSFAMVDRRFDRELLELMARSGCEFLVVGMETTITRVLKLVHKSADREENLRFLADARDVGLPLIVNLIPDLPTTTYEEALTALDDVAAYADSLRSVSVFPFEATRSSNVGRFPERFGLQVDDGGGASGQAQYALNHLRNTDPAMTPGERAEVHRRYRQFADSVNSRDYRTARRLGHDPDDALRFAVEELDLLEVDGALLCTNMRTRERVRVPAKAAAILRPYVHGSAFTRRQLAVRAGESAAERLLGNLRKAGMLVDASTGAEHDVRV